MTLSRTMQCPQCGSPRVAQAAPLDLCPSCLLATALSMDDEPFPYQVIAPIGEGSSGLTYLAQAITGAGGYVALAFPGPRADIDAVVFRYQRRKAALAGIRHPGVGRLLAVGVTADRLLYVASEYVAGWPLTSLGSHPSVGIDERVEIARQLTGAIDSAHSAGVVHLNLSAGKVKISTTNGPHAVILGFGWRLIVDGADGDPEVDRLALGGILRDLGVHP